MPQTKVRLVPETELGRYAWRRLRTFWNVSSMRDRLMAKHQLSKEQAGNAEKQARQIRYCLQQAEELYTASEEVSASTSPLLLYYSVLSLANAEILFKQTGASSLDAARELSG